MARTQLPAIAGAPLVYTGGFDIFTLAVADREGNFVDPKAGSLNVGGYTAFETLGDEPAEVVTVTVAIEGGEFKVVDVQATVEAVEVPDLAALARVFPRYVLAPLADHPAGERRGFPKNVLRLFETLPTKATPPPAADLAPVEPTPEVIPVDEDDTLLAMPAVMAARAEAPDEGTIAASLAAEDAAQAEAEAAANVTPFPGGIAAEAAEDDDSAEAFVEMAASFEPEPEPEPEPDLPTPSPASRRRGKKRRGR